MAGGRQGASHEIARSSRPESNGLTREWVSGIQRARMIAAMFDVVAEHGAGNVTVAHIVGRSGVSRRTFYEIFEDREDCLLAAFDEAVYQVTARVVPSYEAPGRWRDRIRVALTALAQFLDEEPGMARLLVAESLAAGPRALGRRARIISRLVSAVEEGRTETESAGELPSVTGEGLVGAVLSIIQARLLQENPGRLLDLVNPLMGMIVLPYLGSTASRRELARPMPVSPHTPRNGRSAPLRELEMRLTYRTVMVLSALASNPGSSNRVIADSAGISDRGQISKLLARLQGLGLIENGGTGAASGAPNAWMLTDKGKEVHGAFDRQLAEA